VTLRCPNPRCGRDNRSHNRFCITCGTPLQGELPPGFVLQGRYQVTSPLGGGGMGAIYLARDGRRGGKVVAIKENSDTSQEAQQQFELEATLLANLDHRNLPQVTDRFIELSGRQYLVMEYVEGDDLDTLLADNGNHPFAERQVLSWADELLDALDYLHTREPPVIHRDVKPANVKLTPQGTLKLVDFGISKVLHPRMGTFTAARGRGTPGFAPPEQQVGGTDARSDIYALGATLYCLLTGHKPPDANDLASGKAALAPRQLNPALSRNTERVILKAMKAHPETRYQSIAQMRRSLHRGRLSRLWLVALLGLAATLVILRALFGLLGAVGG
jgi:serine/threonine protein kinase